MIERRKFLGTIALGLAMPACGKLAFADDKLVADRSMTLSWATDTIQMIPSRSRQLPPVVTGLTVRPKGNDLAIVGDDHVVNIYDIKDEKFVHQLESHKDWVRCARYSPDGAILATAGNDRTLKMHDTKDYSGSDTIAKLSHAIIDIQFSEDGKRLATVGFDRTMRIFDVASRRLESTIRCDCADIHTVAFDSSGQLIAEAGRNGVVQVWSVEDSQKVTEYKRHSKRIRAIEFFDDTRIISCGDDCKVVVTDIGNNNESTSLPRHGGKLYAICVLPNATLATGGSDNMIYIWNLEDFSQIGVLKGHTGTVSCLDTMAGRLYSGSFDTRVRIWAYERNASLSAPRFGSSNFETQNWEPIK